MKKYIIAGAVLTLLQVIAAVMSAALVVQATERIGVGADFAFGWLGDTPRGECQFLVEAHRLAANLGDEAGIINRALYIAVARCTRAGHDEDLDYGKHFGLAGSECVFQIDTALVYKMHNGIPTPVTVRTVGVKCERGRPNALIAR